jgi:pimeloyl-ACP methyl ester carboxylesterase
MAGAHMHHLTQSSVARLAVLLLFLSIPGASSPAWKDPSPHLVRLVQVEPGVKLEVLDWGGSGDPVLLLAGHGDTGHIFDDFAPGLTGNFHAFALTRRGFGASTQPVEGYDLATMVRDISKVVDALKLARVHLVGHSIAGDEMTRFALTFPDKMGKLVYLDAAYDRVEAQRVEATFPKLPPSSEPTPSELRSPEAVRSYIGRTEILMPEAEIRATKIFGPDGRFLRPVTPGRILGAVANMVEHPNYQSIRAPILAMYAIPKTPAQLVPRYKSADQETRQALDRIFEIRTRSATMQRDRFRKTVPQAHVVELYGASHYLFISDREKVLQAVNAFLRTPSMRCGRSTSRLVPDRKSGLGRFPPSGRQV